MKEVFEYRRAPSRGVLWLGVSAFSVLVTMIILTGADELIWLIWTTGPLTIGWMLIPHPVAGIRIDDDYLVLSAWRNPRAIPLDDIAYLRATEASAETNIAIVYKDGSEEGTFVGDMPEISVLMDALAVRGIAVRGVY